MLQLRAATLEAATRSFGEEYEIAEQVIDLVEVMVGKLMLSPRFLLGIDILQGKRSYIVGTLYKSMKLKPSVLDQYKDIIETSAPIEPLSDFTQDDDCIG